MSELPYSRSENPDHSSTGREQNPANAVGFKLTYTKLAFILMATFGLILISTYPHSHSDGRSHNRQLAQIQPAAKKPIQPTSQSMLASLKLPITWESLRPTMALKELSNGIKLFLIKDPKSKGTVATLGFGGGNFHESLLPSVSDGIAH